MSKIEAPVKVVISFLSFHKPLNLISSFIPDLNTIDSFPFGSIFVSSSPKSLTVSNPNNVLKTKLTAFDSRSIVSCSSSFERPVCSGQDLKRNNCTLSLVYFKLSSEILCNTQSQTTGFQRSAVILDVSIASASTFNAATFTLQSSDSM